MNTNQLIYDDVAALPLVGHRVCTLVHIWKKIRSALSDEFEKFWAWATKRDRSCAVKSLTTASFRTWSYTYGFFLGISCDCRGNSFKDSQFFEKVDLNYRKIITLRELQFTTLVLIWNFGTVFSAMLLKFRSSNQWGWWGQSWEGWRLDFFLLLWFMEFWSRF